MLHHTPHDPTVPRCFPPHQDSSGLKGSRPRGHVLVSDYNQELGETETGNKAGLNTKNKSVSSRGPWDRRDIQCLGPDCFSFTLGLFRGTAALYSLFIDILIADMNMLLLTTGLFIALFFFAPTQTSCYVALTPLGGPSSNLVYVEFSNAKALRWCIYCLKGVQVSPERSWVQSEALYA